MAKGIPFIIAAPSGAGKTSLVNALIEADDSILVSVSYTTRCARSDEKEGIHYHFVKPHQFEQLIVDNELIEYAKVFDNYYGTSRAWVEEKLAAGYDVILEIDWQGAQQIRHKLSSAVSIFILPPSFSALFQRLHKRSQDEDLVIQRRMQSAQTEMSHYREFDYLVVNDDFNTALADLKAIVRSEHLRRERRVADITHLITNLLATKGQKTDNSE